MKITTNSDSELQFSFDIEKLIIDKFGEEEGKSLIRGMRSELLCIIKTSLDSLTNEERSHIFSYYCTHCGDISDSCWCAVDPW